MGKPGRLPIDTTDTTQIVAHVDADCFYASCERLRDPQLEGEPVVVGMGYEDGETSGAVATASYEAREYGVESAQSIDQALQALSRRESDEEPSAFYRPVDMEYYEEVSQQVRSVLAEFSNTIRAVSIDEAYLDVTQCTDYDHVEAYAEGLKSAIAESVGIAVSVGVAPTMSAAKIASDHDKPDGLTVLKPGDVQSFLAPLPVEAVHEVGPKTARKLDQMGIETAGDLAEADPAVLEERFGERGLAIYRYARGEDAREVTPVGKPKSLSRESSFATPTDDQEVIRDRVTTLASAVADRADRRDALYQTIGIKVITPPYDVHTRERSLSGPVDRPELLDRVALDLLEEFSDDEIRKVGVRVSSLSFGEGGQARLEEWGDGNSPPTYSLETTDELSGQTTLDDFT